MVVRIEVPGIDGDHARFSQDDNGAVDETHLQSSSDRSGQEIALENLHTGRRWYFHADADDGHIAGLPSNPSGWFGSKAQGAGHQQDQ